jgi:HNH endonuclease
VSDYLIDLDTGCWVWQRAKTTAGYGQMYVDGKMAYTHRVFYEGYVADIPAGLVLDHLCRNPSCCNPDHLEPVTFAENVGPIPDGLQIDHLCARKLCVNPDHLQAVTPLDNTRRTLRKRS